MRCLLLQWGRVSVDHRSGKTHLSRYMETLDVSYRYVKSRGGAARGADLQSRDLLACLSRGKVLKTHLVRHFFDSLLENAQVV